VYLGGVIPRDLLKFLRSYRMAVQASVSSKGVPQAAVVGFVVSDDFEFLFDTLESTRKVANLRRSAKAALVVGGLADGDERTAQIEGLADEPRGAELERLKELYFARFPDGRERQKWPGLVYLRIRPTWIRYSDFGRKPPQIVEFDRDALKSRR
jgi:general stress protein 26